MQQLIFNFQKHQFINCPACWFPGLFYFCSKGTGFYSFLFNAIHLREIRCLPLRTAKDHACIHRETTIRFGAAIAQLLKDGSLAFLGGRGR